MGQLVWSRNQKFVDVKAGTKELRMSAPQPWVNVGTSDYVYGSEPKGNSSLGSFLCRTGDLRKLKRLV